SCARPLIFETLSQACSVRCWRSTRIRACSLAVLSLIRTEVRAAVTAFSESRVTRPAPESGHLCLSLLRHGRTVFWKERAAGLGGEPALHRQLSVGRTEVVPTNLESAQQQNAYGY